MSARVSRFPVAGGAALTLTIVLLLLAGSLLPFGAGASLPAPAPAPVGATGPHLPTPTLVSPGGRFPIPLPPHVRPHGQRSPAESVNVYAFRSKEPAPFGITDYAVDANGTTYSYATDEIVGTAAISSYTTYNASFSGYASLGSLQLNLVLRFTSGSSTFYYWPQDVLFIDSSSNTMTFEDNIWNLSSGGSQMQTTTITSGNGSVYSSGSGNFYAAGAGGQSGNGASLVYPAVVQLRCLSTVSSGSPVVYFQFNDGYGWQTYDTAVFGFTRSVKSALFEVNGNSYTPSGLFQDAELVFGGPGSGSTTVITAAQVNLSLQFDNGHNLQEVPNAYNFGSNTAEAVINGIATRVVSGTTGYLASRVTAGSGQLGLVYDRGYSAILNGTSKYPTGSYSINGVPSGSYRNGDLNLTLAPGTYDINLTVNGSVVAAPRITLRGGEYLAFQFTPPPRFPIAFTEHGLPAGTTWSVTVLGSRVAGTNTTLFLEEPNGTYTYSIGGVPGYVASAWSGTDTVAADNTSISVSWTVYKIGGVASEVGLPAGTGWSLRIAGVIYAGVGSTIDFSLANGTYNYTTMGVPGYEPSYAGGSITVYGPAPSIFVAYTRVYYAVAIRPSGIPATMSWILDLGGVNYTSSRDGTLLFHLANGSYPYSAVAAGPYSAAPGPNRFVVAGYAVNLSIPFAPDPGRLLVSVSPGTANLSINGTATFVRNGSFSIDLPAGTYLLNISAPGYLPYSRTVVVAPGQVVPLKVNLTLANGTSHLHPTPALPLSVGVPWSTIELFVGLALVLAAVLAVLVVKRRPRSPPAP